MATMNLAITPSILGTGTYTDILTTLNPGDVYVPANSTDAELQDAADLILDTYVNTEGHGTIHLQPGAYYSLAAPVYLEGHYVSLDGHGARIDASTLTTSDAIVVENMKGPALIWNPNYVRDFTLYGDSAAPAAAFSGNTSRGIVVSGRNKISTTLNGGIDASQTTLVVASNSGMPTRTHTLLLNSGEYVLVTSGFASTTKTVIRGWLDTTPATQANGTAVVSNGAMEANVLDVTVKYFFKNIDLGMNAWLTRFTRVRSYQAFYGFYSDISTAASGVGAENCSIVDSAIFNCYCHFYNKGNIIRVWSTSFDYFYDDQAGGSSESRSIHLLFGSQTEFFGCHFEWNYGGVGSSETNHPFYLENADTVLTILGGKMIYTGTIIPYYNPGTIKTSNASQFVNIKDLGVQNLGRYQTRTSEDVLFVNTDATHASITSAVINVDNLIPVGFSKNDLPAVLSFNPAGGNYFRNGCDDPYTEMSSRGVCTAGGPIATQAGTAESVVPKFGSNMIKIPVGTVWKFTLPAYKGPMKRYAWGFWLNAFNCTGTITITERQITGHWVWNGSTSMSFVEDSRTNNSPSSPISVTGAGTNEWRFWSWKDAYSDPTMGQRVADFFSITIDTSGAGGTNLYAGGFAFGAM